MDIKASISEDHGIAAMLPDDRQILSVGISTGGVAEIRMAQADPARRVIATTIDENGAAAARQYIAERGYDDQITVKLEDVTYVAPYGDGFFDYIYARLVLHYLSADQLEDALAEMYRVLRPGGRLFVVVRSMECADATHQDARYDSQTHLTTRTSFDRSTGISVTYSRYFHTEASIERHVGQAGFDVSYTIAYEERLYSDFARTKLAPQSDHLIELMAIKQP